MTDRNRTNLLGLPCPLCPVSCLRHGPCRCRGLFCHPRRRGPFSDPGPLAALVRRLYVWVHLWSLPLHHRAVSDRHRNRASVDLGAPADLWATAIDVGESCLCRHLYDGCGRRLSGGLADLRRHDMKSVDAGLPL